jgi:hypothetical protein
MTAARAAALPDTITHGRSRGGTVSLAVVEARRVLLHPAWVVVFGYGLVVTGVDLSQGIGHIRRGDAAEFLAILFVVFLPLNAVFAASLVATSARRAGTEETLSALPVTARGRTLALLLAGLAPAAVGGLAAATVWYLQKDLLQPSMEISGGALAATPLLYLGSTALAVGAARWLPWPGVAVVLVIGLFVWVSSTHGSPNAAAVLTAPWIVDPDADRAAVIAGYSDVWHFVYLSGLVGLAATAAVFRDDIRRMIAVGIAVGLPSLFAAWAQLP